MWKSVLSVIAGVVAAMVVVTVGDLVLSALHPPPEGLSMSDRQALADHAASVPQSLKIAMVIYWGVAVFLAGLIARGFGRGRIGPLIAVLVPVLGIALNLYMIPHPDWMTYAAGGSAALGALLGLRAGALVSARRAARPAA
ncbi:hypothetical protein GC169_04630 [bacterium]|nr:hypothetical protein [bacterium]